MAVEELLIKIKSVLDNGGFARAEASMKGLQGTSKAAIGEAAAHANYFNHQMEYTPSLIDRAKNKMNQLGISAKQVGLGMMAAGATIVAAYAMIAYSAVKMAASSEELWGKFAVNMGKGGMEAAAFKAEYNDLANSIAADTGRVKGSVIDMMGKLARVGITTQEELKGASETVTAMAYKLGESDISAMADKYVAAINKPSLEARSLNKLGVNIADVTKVMADQNLTMKDWKDLTVQQRDQILQSTVAMEGGASANDRMKNSAQGMMNQLTNLYNNFMTQVGFALLPVLLDIAKALFPVAKGFLDWFTVLPGPMKTVLVLLPLIVGGLMAIGGALIFLNPVKDVLSTMADKWGKLGGKKKISFDCDKPCPVTGGSSGKSGTLSNPGVAGSLALTAATVYITADIVNAAGQAQKVNQTEGGNNPLITGEAFVSSFGANLPLPMLMNTLMGRSDPTSDPGKFVGNSQGQNSAMWRGLTGYGLPGMGGWSLSSLLPGTASAAGSGGNKGMMNDIFGKKGMLDMSRFKFPSVSDILGTLKSKIPGLNWKVPSVTQVIQKIGTFIKNLNWKIPSVPTIIQKIGEFITNLIWSIPGAGDLIAEVGKFIDWLHWSIPSAGEILQAIVDRMTGGAAGGDGANNAAGGDMANNNDAGYAINNPAKTTKTVSKKTKNETHLHFHIGSIKDKETADYTVDKIVNALNGENKINGRDAA
jgi:hypothetical protein